MASLNLTFDNITNADLLVGDASVVADWNTFFDLPTYGTPFSAVTISGNTVQLFGGSNIIVKDFLLYNNSHIISIIDTNSIVQVNDAGINSLYNLIDLQLPVCKTLLAKTSSSETAIGYLDFITEIFMPMLETAGDNSFESMPNLTSIDLPNLISIGDNSVYGSPLLTLINLPSCTDLGGTVGNDSVFVSTIGNTITLTVPSILMTCNSGNPDGDIQYLQANNTVTIIEVTPTPSPTPTPTPSPTSSIVTTPTPTPTKTSSPTPSVTPTNTPSPTFIPLSGIGVNIQYEYTLEMLGSFAGTQITGLTVPHPVFTDANGVPYAQLDAVTIGGFNGLNN